MKHILDIGTSNNDWEKLCNDWEKLYLDLLKEYKALQDKYNHLQGSFVLLASIKQTNNKNKGVKNK